MNTPFLQTAATRGLAAIALGACAAAGLAQDVLVVAPPDLQPALVDWKAHRESKGLKIVVQAPGDDLAGGVRAVHAASGGKLRFVMIAGDVDRVPCAYRDVGGLDKPGQDNRIATDAPCADTDGDGIPDLAVGRIPVNSAAELRSYLARVVAQDDDRDTGRWRGRVFVAASAPAEWDPLAGAVMEQQMRRMLARNVPPEFVFIGAYANPLSAWCPPPAEFAATVLDRFAEGALVVAYIGHGNAHEFDRIRVGSDTYPILSHAEVAKLECRNGPPVTVLVSCSSGAFDGERDCLAEEMLRRPKGPVAVVASSRTTSAYCAGLLMREMFTSLFQDRVATVGELLLAMRRRLVAPAQGDEERRAFERLAASMYSPDAAFRAADRLDHVSMINLLGDPCVAIRRPAVLPLAAPQMVTTGTTIEATGTAPAAGKLVVEVGRRLDASTPLGSRKSADEWRATYARSNALEVACVEANVEAGAFRVRVAVPADARTGPGYVRAWFEGGGICAAGGRNVEILAPPTPADSGK